MNKQNQKRLEKAGWRVGNYDDFLGLSKEEKQKVEATAQIQSPKQILILDSYNIEEAFNKLIKLALTKCLTKKEAADLLGISHRTLNRKIVKYNL